MGVNDGDDGDVGDGGMVVFGVRWCGGMARDMGVVGDVVGVLVDVVDGVMDGEVLGTDG